MRGGGWIMAALLLVVGLGLVMSKGFLFKALGAFFLWCLFVAIKQEYFQK